MFLLNSIFGISGKEEKPIITSYVAVQEKLFYSCKTCSKQWNNWFNDSCNLCAGQTYYPSTKQKNSHVVDTKSQCEFHAEDLGFKISSDLIQFYFEPMIFII